MYYVQIDDDEEDDDDILMSTKRMGDKYSGVKVKVSP